MSYDSHGTTFILGGIEKHLWLFIRSSPVSNDVASAYSNRNHGTFVAGLICWGEVLNPDIPGINSDPCAVYDLQVIHNDDPDNGDIDEIYESEFLESLENALKQLANQYMEELLSLIFTETTTIPKPLVNINQSLVS